MKNMWINLFWREVLVSLLHNILYFGSLNTTFYDTLKIGMNSWQKHPAIFSYPLLGIEKWKKKVFDTQTKVLLYGSISSEDQLETAESNASSELRQLFFGEAGQLREFYRERYFCFIFLLYPLYQVLYSSLFRRLGFKSQLLFSWAFHCEGSAFLMLSSYFKSLS